MWSTLWRCHYCYKIRHLHKYWDTAPCESCIHWSRADVIYSIFGVDANLKCFR